MSTVTPNPARWAPDPSVSGQMRWWDGVEWTAYTCPAAPPVAPSGQTSEPAVSYQPAGPSPEPQPDWSPGIVAIRHPWQSGSPVDNDAGVVVPAGPPPTMQGSWQPPAQPTVIALIPSGAGTGLAKLVEKKDPPELTFSAQGIIYHNRQTGFAANWLELRQARLLLSWHELAPIGRGRLIDPISMKLWTVHLVVDAADPVMFAQQHPELAAALGRFGAEGPGSYGVLLPPVQNLATQIGEALAAYGGPRSGGVINQGHTLGSIL